MDAGSALVRLIPGGVDISATKGAPLRVASAANTVVVLADDTAVNRLTDAATLSTGDDGTYADGDLVANGGQMGGGPGGMGGVGATPKYTLQVNGRYIVSDAVGDGVDINGNVAMKGGNSSCTRPRGPTTALSTTRARSP